MALTAWVFVKATTGASVTGIGTVSWVGATDISADDATRAAANTIPAGGASNWLRGYFDFATGNLVPVGANIDGIEAEVDTFGYDGYPVRFNAARLVIGGTIQGTNVSNMPATNWGTPSIGDAPMTLGGSTNLWGATVSAADVRGATFGIAISAKNDEASKNRNAGVDYIRMRIYYTPAGAPPAAYNESIGIAAGSSCGTGPSVGAAANIGLSATAATVDGALAAVQGSIAFNANQGVDNSTLLWIEQHLSLISQAEAVAEGILDAFTDLDLLTVGAVDAEGMRAMFAGLDLSAGGGFDSEMKPEFAGLLNLAVSQDCQFSTSMTAVATLGLDATIEEAYVSQGFLRASLPVLHTVAVDMVGGSVFEISCEVSTQGDLNGYPSTHIPLSISVELAQLLGVSPQLFGIGSSQIQAGGTVSSSATEVLQASFVLGLANRLQSTASVGLAFTWATSLQAAVETTVKQSSICQSVLASGLGLESLSLLNASARITVSGKPQISNSVSVDYRRQFSIVAGAAVWTKGTKVYDSLIVLGIDSTVAGQATAALMDVANLAANAEVQTDSTLKALASIGFVVEQAANVQLLLGVSARGNLAMRKALATEARGDWLRLVSLAQKLNTAVQTTGTIDEGVLIGIEQTLVANVKGMIAGAIATSVSPVIDAQVKVFKEAAATIGLSQEVLTSSVAHFRSAIVAAVTHRLEMVNFDPQVIRIVSELLSRSTVTNEGLKVSRIVDETIVRAE